MIDPSSSVMSSSSSWGHHRPRLTFGQVFLKTFAIVLGHLDIFGAIGACQLLPLAALIALNVRQQPAVQSNDNTDSSDNDDAAANDQKVFVEMATVLQNFTDTNNSNDEDAPLSHACFIVFNFLLATASIILFLVCTGATIHAAGHVITAATTTAMSTSAAAATSTVTSLVNDQDHHHDIVPPLLVPPPPLSLVFSMQRGWKRACPLAGALGVALLLVISMQLLVVRVAARVEYMLLPMAPALVQRMGTVVVTVASLLVLTYTLTGCVFVAPAVVWGRRGVFQAVRESFSLVQGQQWYILLLQLSVALVQASVFVILWTILGDFGLMALLGESTLAVVIAVGGMAMVLLVLMGPAFPAVLGTDLYINLRACQGTYVRDDLLADLRMTTTMADGPEPLLANSLALDDDDDDNGDNEDGTSDAGSGGTGNTNNKNENSADETMASAIV